MKMDEILHIIEELANTNERFYSLLSESMLEMRSSNSALYARISHELEEKHFADAAEVKSYFEQRRC